MLHQKPESPSSHDEKVARIAAEVRARIGQGEPVYISKGGVHHFVPLPGDTRFRGAPIDISDLSQILDLDLEKRILHAEPGVTFAEAVRHTLPHGLLPCVVPELEGITLGGAVAGCSVESMSYVHGGFHDTCLSYEVVSGDGRVLTLSPESDPDLFHMIHGSFGTLAILTKLALKLVPAKPYVRLEYRRFVTAEAFEAELTARCQAKDYDFIDAIVHGARHDPATFVLCLGRFVDKAPFVSSYRWLDIYYQSTRTRTEDYLATFDYCFRYDTECHWLSRTVPPLEWRPVRFLLGKVFLGSTNMIRWSGRLEKIFARRKRPDVVVDVFIPQKRFAEFFRWYREQLDYFPLWIVPYRVPAPYPWLAPAHVAKMGTDMFLDCAIYGLRNDGPVDLSQALEEKTYELGGIKTLISRNHHTREQFWSVYNKETYDAAKARLDPKGVFPNVYDKMHRAK